MAFIRFKHQDDKYDIVRVNGLQLCLDRGMVKEFFRPSERRWIDPLKDPIRKRSDSSTFTMPDRRSNIQNQFQNGVRS
jgi:hypothetical protein